MEVRYTIVGLLELGLGRKVRHGLKLGHLRVVKKRKKRQVRSLRRSRKGDDREKW